MQLETIGDYRLHLIAHELPGGGWDSFISVFKFDMEAGDFKCVLEKRPATEVKCESYEEAVNAASEYGKQVIRELRSTPN